MESNRKSLPLHEYHTMKPHVAVVKEMIIRITVLVLALVLNQMTHLTGEIPLPSET